MLMDMDLGPVARTAIEAGAGFLAVHRIQAAVALREAGITAPILLLGHTLPSGIDLMLTHHITPTLVDWDTARLFSEQANAPVAVHIKDRYRYESFWSGT